MEKYVNMEHLPPAVVFDDDTTINASDMSFQHDSDSDGEHDEMVLSSPMGTPSSKGHVASPPRSAKDVPPRPKTLGIMFPHDDDDDDVDEYYDDKTGSADLDDNIGDSQLEEEGEVY
jgi:hypothetical protein